MSKVYQIIISEKNFTLRTKYGKILRTPVKFYVDQKDKLFWDMQILKAGIRGYDVIELNPPKQEEIVEEPRIQITDELVRPSSQIKNKG